ncbi:MAG: AAA family ATPase [Deltaproteobacteria bacterium CG11_big_fil_rev_8_21_14_0_20_49_13]|nr:MAG: AAA family ATPase [Deltaproteobacteria bacterium CG11_big_fil_rev_8_21_14_0_20_49_13]
MQELFSEPEKRGYEPLAERMRPQNIDDVVDQDHILGKDGPLRGAIRTGELPSIILWGPPGSGKTTIAKVIANSIDAHFFSLSAVLVGVKEVREIIDTAQKQRRLTGKKTILFVDEIHRFNKAQQDAFLPHVESGTVILVGATTENPSFEIISPLLSRSKVYVLNPLTEEGIVAILKRTLADKERGLGKKKIKIDDEPLRVIARTSDGDARRALNTLEIAASLTKGRTSNTNHGSRITIHEIQSALQKKSLMYDKLGEEHYNIISAFIKSMRGGNPDAALYWMARMLAAGEEPLFVARRMVIFASEDISNADPQAIQVAVSCMQSLDFVGMPEGWIPLAQSAAYLATAPKSKSSYLAYKAALKDVEEHGALPVPMHIRNAPTKLMDELGYGDGYKDPHRFDGNFVKQQYLPDKLGAKIYYRPTENGYERHISERLKSWR